MGFEDGPKKGSQKIGKNREKSEKNQLCIFEASGAVSCANFRVELCTTNKVNYILLVKLFEDYKR
ncbi:hypothetical protein L208DRAFT_1399681 [Tricholoma matsutake]|nr:hypothetical protein L208DRAFT_1399681 [Tricholoma matsutake 945]